MKRVIQQPLCMRHWRTWRHHVIESLGNTRYVRTMGRKSVLDVTHSQTSQTQARNQKEETNYNYLLEFLKPEARERLQQRKTKAEVDAHEDMESSASAAAEEVIGTCGFDENPMQNEKGK